MAFANISINVDEGLKAEAETICRGLGFGNLAEVLKIFIEKIASAGTVPVDPPSREPITERPMSEADRRNGMATVRELLDDVRNKQWYPKIKDNSLRVEFARDINGLSERWYILAHKNGADYYAPNDISEINRAKGELYFNSLSDANIFLETLRHDNNAKRMLIEFAKLPVKREVKVGSPNLPPTTPQNQPRFTSSPFSATTRANATIPIRHRKKFPFRFSMCRIQPGTEIEFVKDPAQKAIVVDDRHVRYEEKIWTLSALAVELFARHGEPKQTRRGPDYFSYRGERLTDMRERIERERGEWR